MPNTVRYDKQLRAANADVTRWTDAAQQYGDGTPERTILTLLAYRADQTVRLLHLFHAIQEASTLVESALVAGGWSPERAARERAAWTVQWEEAADAYRIEGPDAQRYTVPLGSVIQRRPISALRPASIGARRTALALAIERLSA